jgi:hypothetical protein
LLIYDQRHATFKAYLSTLTPPAPLIPDEMPDMSELAEAVNASDNVQFAHLLDLLNADLAMTDNGEVRVLSVTVPAL